MKRKGFSFIEIIVTIVIIGILSTLTTLSINSWIKNSRDAKRLGDLNTISSALENYYFKNKEYPYPGEYIKITFSGNTLGYQGSIKESLTKKLDLKSPPKDPLSNSSYTYSINKSKNQFQILAFLEKNKEISYNKSKKVFAESLNYNNLSESVKGNNIGTFLDIKTNEPIEKFFSGTYQKEIKNYNTGFNIVFKNDFNIIGSGDKLMTAIENFRNDLSKTDNRLNLYFKFDEGIGNEIKGKSKNKIIGTLSGNISWSEGVEGKGLFKDADTGKAIIPHSSGISLTGKSTISLWFKPLEIPSKNINLLEKGDNFGINFNKNGNIEGYFNDNILTGKVNIHRRNNIILNYNNSGLNLFKDGNKLKNISISGITENSNKMHILSGDYKGVIDELRIYKGNILSGTIDSIYNSYK